jgi:hypothetical protein
LIATAQQTLTEDNPMAQLNSDKLFKLNDRFPIKVDIEADDIKEIINQAIVNSEKRASRRFFGGLKKKRSENGDVIFLTEADFKDR